MTSETTTRALTQALTVPQLRLPGVHHAFFTRIGGVSEGIYASLNAGEGSRDTRQSVAENKARIAEAMGVAPGALVAMHQTHSARALAIDAAPAERPKVDGLATATPHLALMALAADCAPLLFADPVARVVGAAHAGWRGAVGGVIEATVDAMVGLGATRSAIVAAIGPTIAQASYEVGPEFAPNLIAVSPDAGDLFAPSETPGRQRFDLPGYVARRCRAAGIDAVHDLGRDTYADEMNFFSYRRATHRGEPDYGRLASVIVLR